MQINDKTTIPLWSVIASIPLLVGSIFWISYIAYTSNANSTQITDLQKSKEEQYRLLIDIKSDVLIIKERVNALTKNKEGER